MTTSEIAIAAPTRIRDLSDQYDRVKDRRPGESDSDYLKRSHNEHLALLKIIQTLDE